MEETCRMDVKACEICKKLNTEEPLLGVIETRAPRPGAMSANPTDPLISFRVVVTNRAVPFEEDWLRLHTMMLCKTCSEKRVDELLAELLTHLCNGESLERDFVHSPSPGREKQIALKPMLFRVQLAEKPA